MRPKIQCSSKTQVHVSLQGMKGSFDIFTVQLSFLNLKVTIPLLIMSQVMESRKGAKAAQMHSL